MAAVRTLFARASQGRLYLRHRRVLVPRHHARRRHADHRDGRDERLPQGTAGQDPRPQRPSAGAAAGIAADRLEGRRRAHQPGRRASGSRRPSSTARRWRPRRSTPPACSCAASAPTISNNLTSIAKNIKQGTLEGFDEGQGVAIGRRLADQLSLHAGDSITLVAPQGRRDPDGHDAAHQALQGRRRVRDRHVGIRRRPSCSCRCRRRRPISTATTT